MLPFVNKCYGGDNQIEQGCEITKCEIWENIIPLIWDECDYYYYYFYLLAYFDSGIMRAIKSAKVSATGEVVRV